MSHINDMAHAVTGQMPAIIGRVARTFTATNGRRPTLRELRWMAEAVVTGELQVPAEVETPPIAPAQGGRAYD